MKILRRVQVEQAILSQCLAPSRAVNSSTAIRQVQYIHLRRTVELLTLLAHEGGEKHMGHWWSQPALCGCRATAAALQLRPRGVSGTDRQTDKGIAVA